MNEPKKTTIENAGNERQPKLIHEVWLMLRQHKKYWLFPVLVGLLVIGLLIILGGTAAAPFIYTLF